MQNEPFVWKNNVGRQHLQQYTNKSSAGKQERTRVSCSTRNTAVHGSRGSVWLQEVINEPIQ